MLTSSLLLTAFSSRYADVIVADSSSSLTDMLTSSLLLIVMTSSLLLNASSRMYADVIKAVSLFLSISNARHLCCSQLSPVDMLTSSLLILALALLIPDIYCSSSFFDISSSRLHRFCSRSHFRMRPVLFTPKRSNEQATQ
ncbi:hypothetical protein F511_23360 [Dorcoceras hygrometricum]|uniref:Uncharacterized protein n=1 Tax=Dorcoceras hygrometricum TaxID=472368 RepID=A0A2Z7CMQ2_9LAMI|nr:hypothetical protein F511_23360 [Dorcoceras hygrometricum]